MQSKPGSASSMIPATTHWKKASVFLFLTLLFACGGKENEPSPADNAKDREIILAHWVDNIIIPSYEKFQSSFEAMQEKEDAFIASPDQTSLSALREAWVNAYTEWQKVELLEFGPADKYTLRNFFNIYPADVNGILTNMNDPSVNLDLPAAYPTQGFPALDYLLNGTGSDDATILAAYTTDPDAAKRIAYLDRVTTRMTALLTNVVSEWNGPYRETFLGRTGLDIGSSTGVAVNAFVLYYERHVRSGKIGIPSGAAFGTTGIAYPEKVEAFYKKDISLQLAKTAHQAAMDFFNGKNVNTGSEGPSFKSYLDALGVKDASTGTMLSDLINSQFANISGELDQLSPSLFEQVQTDNQKMVTTYNAMQALVRMLKVDMTSAMSVTITYTDNDGD
ncbi:MAG TPA: imelysin family protein [Chryseosolibacter sp.]|nr:imelysin family protein [Chryseosolibacter sp.]